MTVTPRTFATFIGSVLAVIGFFALILPISIDDRYGTTDCGSALIASETVKGADMGRDLGTAMAGLPRTSGPSLVNQCSDALGSRRMWAWPLFGIGLIAVFGAQLVRTEDKPAAPVDEQDATQP